MKIYYLLATSLIFASCQRGVYLPDKVHSPGFVEGGEAKLDFSVKPQKSDSNGSLVSFSSDLAYAPINHLGIMASYRSVNNKTVIADDFYLNDRHFFRFNGGRVDIGAGYFGATNHKGKYNAHHGYPNKTKYEIYAGFGRGTIKNTGFVDTGATGRTDVGFNAKYNRIFIQPAVGFTKQHFSLMGGFRFTYQKYSDIESPNPAVRYSLIPKQSLDLTRQTFAFVEPFIELQAGYKYVMFNYQFGWATQVGGPSLRYALGLPYMTFGILFHFSPSFLKDTKKKEDTKVEPNSTE